jgi:hypothetical protein
LKEQIKKGQLAEMVSESWINQLDQEMDPNDTMSHLNRMALVTSELAGRLNAIIDQLAAENQKRK